MVIGECDLWCFQCEVDCGDPGHKWSDKPVRWNMIHSVPSVSNIQWNAVYQWVTVMSPTALPTPTQNLELVSPSAPSAVQSLLWNRRMFVGGSRCGTWLVSLTQYCEVKSFGGLYTGWALKWMCRDLGHSSLGRLELDSRLSTCWLADNTWPC